MKPQPGLFGGCRVDDIPSWDSTRPVEALLAAAKRVSQKVFTVFQRSANHNSDGKFYRPHLFRLRLLRLRPSAMLTARKLGSSSSLVVKLDRLWARSTSSDELNSPSTSVQINNLLGCTCRPDMGEESPSPNKNRYTHILSSSK